MRLEGDWVYRLELWFRTRKHKHIAKFIARMDERKLGR